MLEEVGKYNLEDENLSPENEEQLKNIKAQLEAKQKEYTTALENSAKPIAVTPGADPSQAPVVTPTPTPVAPQEVEETEEVEEAEDVEETETETPTPTKSKTQENIENAKEAADLLKALDGKTWNNLTKDEKAALAASPFVKDIESLDDASREKIKTFFYNGRKNYQAGIAVGDVKRAIDTYGETVGCPRKIEGAYTNNTSPIGYNPTQAPKEFSLSDTLKSNNKPFQVKYTLKEVLPPKINKTGETVYTSEKGQEYALQLNESGEYELVQYPWHKGYSIADQTQSN